MKLTIEDDRAPESNELDRNAMGGTELMKHALYSKISGELLDQFQIIPSRVRELDDDKKKILWLHDLPLDPESAHLKDGGWEKFDKLVWVSHWQKQQYHDFLGVPFGAGVVMQNAIEPFPQYTPREREGREVRLIYHTTPHRGLEILIPVMEQIEEELGRLDIGWHLDVYSSFDIYGWPERNKPYEALFEKIKAHNRMTYHGFQPNEVVREALLKADIFAFPSIWQETSCIAMIEALAAGCVAVHSSLGALPETAANWSFQYDFIENVNDHATRFAHVLIDAMRMVVDSDISNRLDMQARYFNGFYSWETRAMQWNMLLQGIMNGAR